MSGKSEKAVSAPLDTLEKIVTVVGGIYNNTPTAQADTDLEVVPFACDEFGRIKLSASVTAAADAEKAEDAAHSTGATGSFVLGVRSDSAAAMTSTAGDYSPFAVNSLGAQYVNIDSGFQLASATGLLKLEDSVQSNGDAGVFVLGVRFDSPGANTSANGDYTAMVCNSFGVQHVNLDYDFQRAAATSLLKLEDAAAASGDAGVALLAKRTDSASTQTSTDGDYTLPSANLNGCLHVEINRTYQSSQASCLLKNEDAAFSGGDAGVLMLVTREDTPANGTSADRDYVDMKSNTVGAVYTDTAHAVATWGVGSLAAASVLSASYSTLVTNSSKARIVNIFNDTDRDVLISFNATDAHAFVPTQTSLTLDLAANGRWIASNVSARAVGSDGTSGTLYASVTI